MSFDSTRFCTPPAALRGAPFWALNGDLTDHERLREQIDAFKAMGMGGYHLHVRFGLKTPYLGPDFMAAIRACREHGAANGMLSYLYDEDTWPSGAAGGMVTRNVAFRQRWAELHPGRPQACDNTAILAAYRLTFTADGRRRACERVDPSQAGEDCWFLSRLIAPDSDRFNGAAYLDVLNPAAVDAFIASTHERYLAAFGGTFPADVPSIFTDEPAFAPTNPLCLSDRGTARLPWTDDLPQTFRAVQERDLLDLVPEIVWPGVDGPSEWRWRFWDHVAERFATAFPDRIGAWCAAHGIALTGHLLAEQELRSQMARVAETMRHYRSFHIPGIDILRDAYEPSTAKQAVSVARQDRRSAVMSELYGVTQWDFPFRGHKCQGDWQAALGITLRVPHLAWLSMEGDGKRDCPAAIGPQSPWYREYPLLENHFARLNAALTCGRPLVHIGVIHPIESGWMHWGVEALDGAVFADQERLFHELIEHLLDNQLDFDFIAESLLPNQEQATDAAILQVGAMAYAVVVVPQLITIRASTLASLQQFIERGGTVLVLGALPERCDGAVSSLPAERLAHAHLLPRPAISLLPALEPWRELDVGRPGVRQTKINHQLRVVGPERILFCCHRLRDPYDHTAWSPPPPDPSIRVKGLWQVRELDTADGQEYDCTYTQHAGWTSIPWPIQPHAHRLFRLLPGPGSCQVSSTRWMPCGDCPEPLRVRREEPNVLLLDRAAWRCADEPWQPEQESLRTALHLAARFGWPEWAQPYCHERGATHRIARRFTFDCAVSLSGIRLVCERLAEARIRLDGQPVPALADGWWIDRDLPTLTLGDVTAGRHVLEVELPCDAVNRHLEWCYLLGDFSVAVRGGHARLHADDEAVVWGDAAPQGLAFYGGNLEYHLRLTITQAGPHALRCPLFAGPLLRVLCDGRDRGAVAFAPYRVELGDLALGEHSVVIRAYGNRFNTFGALHNVLPPGRWRSFTRGTWRTQDAAWNEAWQLRPIGIARAPILERAC